MTQTCSSGWMVASIRLIYNPYTLLSHGLTKYCCKILQVSSLFTTENQRWKSWTRKQRNINETSIKHDQSMYIKEFMCPKSLKGAGKHQIIFQSFQRCWALPLQIPREQTASVAGEQTTRECSFGAISTSKHPITWSPKSIHSRELKQMLCLKPPLEERNQSVILGCKVFAVSNVSSWPQ